MLVDAGNHIDESLEREWQPPPRRWKSENPSGNFRRILRETPLGRPSGRPSRPNGRPLIERPVHRFGGATARGLSGPKVERADTVGISVPTSENTPRGQRFRPKLPRGFSAFWPASFCSCGFRVRPRARKQRSLRRCRSSNEPSFARFAATGIVCVPRVASLWCQGSRALEGSARVRSRTRRVLATNRALRGSRSWFLRVRGPACATPRHENEALTR